MSGGPPHHPHNRQVPPANTAWNHLQGFQVPNFFPRQPQLAHMSNDPSLMHHHNLLNDMLKNDSPFPRDCVDLSLTRSDNQNGGPLQSPISLSVRDTNKINSMPLNELEVHAVEHSKSSSLTIKPTGSGLKVPASSFGSSGVLPYPSIPGKSTSPGVISLSPYHKSSSPSPKLQNSGHLAATVDMLATNLGLIEPTFNLPTTNTDTISSSSAAATNPLLLTASSLQTKSFSQTLFPVNPGILGSNFGPKSSTLAPNPASMALSSHSSPAISIEISKNLKRATSRVDSILERLNPNTAAENIINKFERKSEEPAATKKTEITDKLEQIPSDKSSRVIIQHSSNFDENSNSNSINNIPTVSNNEDNMSIGGNEDSLDSNKSRRKRKPSKTIKVPKEEEKMESLIGTEKEIEPTESKPKEVEVPENSIESESAKDPITLVGKILEDTTVPDLQQSTQDLESLLPEKPSRKTSSESETIDDIAAMVQEGLKEKEKHKLDKVEESTFPKLSPEPEVNIPKVEEKVTDLANEHFAKQPEQPTVAAKKEANTHFVEVENRLEEMFAGIEDSSDPLKSEALNIANTNLDDVDGSNLEDIDDTKMEQDVLEKLDDPVHIIDSSPEVVSEVVSSVSASREVIPVTPTKEVTNKSSPKKAKRKALARSRSSEPPESKAKISKVNNKTPTKKLVKQTQSNCKIDSAKDIYAYDSGSNASSSRSRGPFIQIRGPRDSPVSVNVVNTSQNDEEGERKQYKVKKYHDDTEYRHKVRSKGLHCSTLSNKYDAQTRDASWICAFCKRGPHTSDFSNFSTNERYIPPGDLFGPYFITKQCTDYERLLEDPLDKQFKSKKISKLLENNPLLRTQASKKSKKKSLDAESNMYLGITETGNKTFEIWAHEDCIVWSPGTYLVGPKIVGLEEAVWSSCSVSCNHCQKTGANIFCLKRGCLNSSHVDCARISGWMLLENSFKAYCQDHRVP